VKKSACGSGIARYISTQSCRYLGQARSHNEKFTTSEPGSGAANYVSVIGAEFLSLIDRIGRRVRIPAVRGLMIPVVGEQRGKDAEFCALELDDGAVGLSYVWLGGTLAALQDEPFGTALAGMDGRALAAWYGDPDEAKRTLGFAAINAISQSFFRQIGYRPDTAADSIGLIEPAATDHIGMIGLFPPLVDRILASGARLTVAELNPRFVTENERYRVTLDPMMLAVCNKVVTTSTVLLNDTLDAVLQACCNATYFGIIGPTAGCVPDPLFARGVDTLGGTRVTDLEGFRAAMARGEPWGRTTQKYCIRRRTYPGLDALLARRDRG